MVELAGHILESKAGHFDPAKFKDEYEDALKELVRRKASGKPIKVAEPAEKPGNVVNLMDALKASLKGKPAGETTNECSGFAAGAGTPGGEEGAPVDGKTAQGGVRSHPTVIALRKLEAFVQGAKRRSNPELRRALLRIASLR